MGTVIHVVCADHLPCKALHKVIFLVGASCGGKKTDGLRPILRFCAHQAFGDQGERLVPSGGAKSISLAHKRYGKPLIAVNKAPGKAPFNAGAPLVEGCFAGVVAGHICDFTRLFIDLHDQFAPHDAVGADCFDVSRFPRSSLSHRRFIGESADGADLNALTAENTVRMIQFIAGGGIHRRIFAASDIIHCVVAGVAIAYAHAPPAKHTFVSVAQDERVAVIKRIAVRVVGWCGVGGFCDIQLIAKILQQARAVAGAGKAIQRVFGDYQFEDGPPCLQYFGGVRVDDHPLRYRSGAGGKQFRAVFRFHQTDSAGPNRFKSGEFAEHRDVNPRRSGCLEDGGFGGSCYMLVVNRNINHRIIAASQIGV